MNLDLAIIFLVMIVIGFFMGVFVSLNLWDGLKVGKLKFIGNRIQVELDVDEEDLMECKYVSFEIVHEGNEVKGDK